MQQVLCLFLSETDFYVHIGSHFETVQPKCASHIECACSAGYDVTAEFKGGASVPIGQPIANMRCYMLDAQQQLLPIGMPGELMVSGIQLARGYLKRPDLTAEKFIPNPYSGGDKQHERLYRTGACWHQRCGRWSD